MYKCQDCELTGTIGFLAHAPHDHPRSFTLKDATGTHQLTVPAGISQDDFTAQRRAGR